MAPHPGSRRSRLAGRERHARRRRRAGADRLSRRRTGLSARRQRRGDQAVGASSPSPAVRERGYPGLNELLDKGFTDKQDIYSKVVEELGVPRPTVRRVARDLRNELLQKIKILQSEVPEMEIAQGKTTQSTD